MHINTTNFKEKDMFNIFSIGTTTGTLGYPIEIVSEA